MEKNESYINIDRLCGIPLEFKDATFDKIKGAIYNPIKEQLKKVVYEEAPSKWPILSGVNGCGKTTLAVGLFRLGGYHPKFINYDNLLSPNYDVALATYNCAMSDEPYVIIDDIKSSTANRALEAAEWMRQIIKHRYNERLFTVITTNAIKTEFDLLFEEDVISRLKQRSVFIRIPVKDNRALAKDLLK